jgi:hypothetical protein
LLPQALPSELEIVEGPAGTIKLPFRKLNLIFCEQLGERASKAETLRLNRKRHLQEVAGSCGERFVASRALKLGFQELRQASIRD